MRQTNSWRCYVFILMYESKGRYADEPWTRVIQYFETRADALRAYNLHEPRDGGDFGPVLYRNVILARELSRWDDELR